MWGDAQDRIPVLINGKRLLVTRNLESFLRRQRDTFSPKEEPSRVFWIDAICIDHTNLEERSKQVAFMADIYEEADTVLVWLGEETPISRVAMAALSPADANYNSDHSDEEVLAAFDYFRESYWERLWIVQELYHARRIILQSGSLQLDWASLLDSGFPLFSVQTIEGHRRRRTYIEGDMSSNVGPHYAVEVLSTYGSRECLDPRDSVYGLRSFCPLLMSVVPNYSSNIAEVFTAASRVIISNSSVMDLFLVLERVHRQRPSSWNVPGTSHLPTWVPD
jgi:hypothetical protein